MTGAERPGVLARLNIFVGEWSLEARFPGSAGGTGMRARTTFEWILDGQFLIQRTETPLPEAPDSLTIVCVDPQTGGYIQHYYDSRGVARRYAMSLEDGIWRPGHHRRRVGEVLRRDDLDPRLHPRLPQDQLTCPPPAPRT